MSGSRTPGGSRFDVVVCGGGPAGSATALGLLDGDPPLRVAVLTGPPGRPGMGETLTPSALPLLERLGVARAFRDDGPLPSYGTRSAWGSDEPYDNEAVFDPRGAGWRVDRGWFDALLLREAAARGAVVREGVTVRGIEAGDDGRWRVALASPAGDRPAVLDAAFLVDATGRRAMAARRLGARVSHVDRLVGLAVLFESPSTTDGQTLVEACEEGWWYSFVVPGPRRLVVLMSDSDVVKRHNRADPAGWHALLKQTRHVAGVAAGAGVPLGPPRILPAQTRRLDPVTGPGWLAVGDAATTFDPLSSQGLVKALRSAVLGSYAARDALTGNASGILKYSQIIMQEFNMYLAARRDFYRREARWADAPFWRRRQGRVTLEPQDLVRVRGSSGAWGWAGAYLSPEDLARLRAVCDAPPPAYEVVAAFRALCPGVPDERIILALQEVAAG